MEVEKEEVFSDIEKGGPLATNRRRRRRRTIKEATSTGKGAGRGKERSIPRRPRRDLDSRHLVR